MTRAKIVPYLTFAAAIAFAVAPLLTPFNGFDPSAYPVPQIDPPVQPAGYAFAIWGLIYIWLLISTGVGATFRIDASDWHPHQLPLLGSLLVGSIWLWVANVSPVWATVLIWTMLILALWALRLTPRKERILLRAPIGLYAGWLTAASWVSIGLLGAGYDIVFGQFGWAFVCIVAAFAFAVFVIVKTGSITTYIAGVTWALLGIAVKSAQLTPMIALLAGVGAMILGIVAIWQPRPNAHGSISR